MTDPVLQFFESLGRAFKPKLDLARDFELALLVLVIVLVALRLSRPFRERLERKARFRRLARERGLSAAEQKLVADLAARAGSEPLALLERRDEFERATARALGPSRPDAPAREVHRIREAFAFDHLPESAPLYSSRELTRGTPLLVGPLPGRVVSVAEASFAVAVGEEPPLAPGATANLALTRGRDARYRLSCRVREIEPAGPGSWHLWLDHDEAPMRVQAREGVRVPVGTPVGLRTLPPADSPPGVPAGVTALLRGELLDLSGGGAMVSSPRPLAAGDRLTLTFDAGGARFEKLGAEVLWTEQGPEGACHAHLAFHGVSEPERDRLVAAVTRIDLAGQAARHLGGP